MQFVHHVAICKIRASISEFFIFLIKRIYSSGVSVTSCDIASAVVNPHEGLVSPITFAESRYEVFDRHRCLAWHLK